MPKLNLNNPVEYRDVGVTVYRSAMSPALSAEISEQAALLVADKLALVSASDKKTRRFQASPIMELGAIPILATTAQETFGNVFRTMRLNVQGPDGRQGWHQDYIPEPLVWYPEHEGYIDLNPCASSIEEARSYTGSSEIVRVPIEHGDVAALQRGGEIFHRGLNASPDATRITIVLH